MRSIGLRHAMVLGLGVLTLLAAGAAKAQVPNEAAEINACACLRLASGALAADKDAKSQALAAANQQLADLDAQLASARARIDVNNPDSVANYKALLERRDAAYRQISPAQSDAAQAVARYNASVDDYNRRCAGRPFNSELEAQIQAHPNCPPSR
jgi:nitrate/nitrite-specific signal transduction histidine kinase